MASATKTIRQPLTYRPAHQLNATETRLCAIDLNISKHLAVCSILTVEGTVVASRFIGGGTRQLGRIARNRSKTGIIARCEQDNAQLWAKVRALDEQYAHLVSARIVQFAKEHGTSVLVFEHLGTFKLQKGTYSRRANEKRSYWVRGKIFKYTKYKSWNEHGIITRRVSPRNTSRECARCGAQVARYDAGQPAEGYTPGAPLVFCAHCNRRDNTDRNASIVIGKRLFARYQQNIAQEKPPPSLATGKPAKAGGDARSQDAKGCGRPSTDQARHGTSVAHGTAQGHVPRMGERCPGIPLQLHLFSES